MCPCGRPYYKAGGPAHGLGEDKYVYVDRRLSPVYIVTLYLGNSNATVMVVYGLFENDLQKFTCTYVLNLAFFLLYIKLILYWNYNGFYLGWG